MIHELRLLVWGYGGGFGGHLGIDDRAMGFAFILIFFGGGILRPICE